MTPKPVVTQDGLGLAQAIRAGHVTATAAVESALQEIARNDRDLNCFTAVLDESAREQAVRVDRLIAHGGDPGPWAGVPFAVKNLFDIEGVTTLAGSRIHAERPPAARDATAVARLKRAGAILVGALNMDEYAYGFTTENSHYGATRNPHDLGCVAGGSSGGSAASVAAGMVPLTLGSDTNGSIRLPAAFCGVFGLKPTYGRISRAGTVPFVESLDHVGPFARSVRDLAAAFDVLQGHDARDPVSANRETELCTPHLSRGAEGLRIAIAGDYFERLGMPEAFQPVLRAARALGVERTIALPHVEKARAAAYIVTACEGGHGHMADLRTRPADFDPLIVTRLLAGALLPEAWYRHAQRFRTVFRELMREIFRSVDVILAPATPCPAIRLDQPTITVGGVEVPSRPNLGVFTQPLSFIGLPVICVPVFEPGRLPLGVQVVAAPYHEAAAFRVARHLEELGVARAHQPSMEKAA